MYLKPINPWLLISSARYIQYASKNILSSMYLKVRYDKVCICNVNVWAQIKYRPQTSIWTISRFKKTKVSGDTYKLSSFLANYSLAFSYKVRFRKTIVYDWIKTKYSI